MCVCGALICELENKLLLGLDECHIVEITCHFDHVQRYFQLFQIQSNKNSRKHFLCKKAHPELMKNQNQCVSIILPLHSSHLCPKYYWYLAAIVSKC